jgi:hypothetical protein
VIVLTFVLSESTEVSAYSSYWKFQFSMAIISTILCGLYFILALVKADVGARIAPVVALLLALLYGHSVSIAEDMLAPAPAAGAVRLLTRWFAAAICGTFYTDGFTVTTNGYFADWIAFYASFLAAYVHF